MIRYFPLALLIAGPALAAPATFQDAATLDRAVAGFTGHAIGEDGGARTAVDARLKLGQCPTVALSWHGVSHDAVMVTCSGPDWHIYVPVQAAAAPVAVAASTMPAVLARPVKAAIVIKRGDPVMVEATDSGFSISREAVAMGDAAAGQRFMAKGDGDKAPFQAVALDTGRATLPGWQAE
jgi:flagella basal body P-ring formation protein FlgA